MMRWSLSVAIVLLLCVVIAEGQSCPKGKGVCVQEKFCPKPQGASKRLIHHKCILEKNQRGICCPEKDTPQNKDCTTVRNGPGRCLAEDQCQGSFTREFLVTSVGSSNWWKVPSGVCYQEKHKKYYCCPLDQQKPNPTLPPKTPVQPWNDNAYPTCKTTTNRTGKCVPLVLCDEFRAHTMKSNRWSTYRNIPSNYKCNSDASDSTSICCADPAAPYGLIRHTKAKKLPPKDCGPIGYQDRIVEGKEAGLGQFPWMANLMYYRKEIKTTLCSGSLIHAQYVLTAAHCMNRYKPISVRLGEHDLSKDKDCMGNVCAKQIKEYLIADIKVHERYNARSDTRHIYDIALVRLHQPAKLMKDQIYPICLPITEQWIMTKPSKLIAAGWGLTRKDYFPDILMHATLDVLKVRPGYCKGEAMICARGENGEGHCSGDSGGPLQQTVRYGKHFRMVLFGVISGGGAECSANDTTAGISVSVASHMNWILKNMDV